jgi:crossover junction endodeoxyribonuclease RusA
MIVLTLPYAVSANVYWRTAARGGRAMTYVSAEAKKYRADVARICAAKGIKQPLPGRLSMHLRLYPHRPLDWQKRQRKLGMLWSDTVQCIDLGNAEKVLADALQGIVYEDDKMLWRLQAERMEPDEHGARVIVAIEQLAVPVAQASLIAEAA